MKKSNTIRFLRDFIPEPLTKISKYDSDYYDIQVIQETNRKPRFDIRSKKYLMPGIKVDIDDGKNIEISLIYDDIIILRPDEIDRFKVYLDIATDFAFNDLKNLVEEGYIINGKTDTSETDGDQQRKNRRPPE